jgi:protein gp37
MAENSAIEWCDHTFNAWVGCTKVSDGCRHCYAEALARRSGLVEWGPGRPRRRTSEANWLQPRKWNRETAAFRAKHGRPPIVFCNSLSDVFDPEVPEQWLAELLFLIEDTPDLRWILVTKRPDRVDAVLGAAPVWFRRNQHVGLMITVCNQQEADRDVPTLLRLKHTHRIAWVGLSIEPMLGPIDLRRIEYHGDEIYPLSGRVTELDGDGWFNRLWESIDWVICGGESGAGSKTRPLHPDWVRSLRDQCAAAGTAFLFKQWGEWAPFDFDGRHGRRRDWMILSPDGVLDIPDFCAPDETEGETAVVRVGKSKAGRLLDGVLHHEVPEALRV